MTQRTYGWPGSGPTDFRGNVNVAEGDVSVEDGNLSVKQGDLSLDGGSSFTTTLQCIPATANRTLSLPDATGVLALVGGNSGQILYNSAGSLSGVANTGVTTSGAIDFGTSSVSSLPAVALSGAWFTGGTSTTTKPQVLIEPVGVTSTGWSTTGTGLGVNGASTFTGRLIDLQLNGSTRFSVSAAGITTASNGLEVTTGSLTVLGTASRGLAITTETYNSIANAGVRLNAQTGTADGALILAVRGTTRATVTVGGLELADAHNISTGTTTGTRIGTATTQRLGFFNATPVVQPAAVTDLTVTATAGTLPTANGTVTIADAAAPTNAELLEYCVELEAKLEAALARLRNLGLIAT